MADVIYSKFLEQESLGNVDWSNAVIRCMLERSTSAYTPNPDHDYVSDLTSNGFVELSYTGGSGRVTCGSATVTIDDANNRVKLDCADAAFGSLSSGETVNAAVFYVQVGGDDTTPANDILICYIDSATNLPAALGGGPFTFQIHADGLITKQKG